MLATPPPAAIADPLDDLSREVYCVLGIPMDVVDMATVREKVEAAAGRRRPFLISTANLNFLIRSQSEPEFRDSLLLSDLCTADGIAVVWLARLLGIPIKHRIAGADFLEAFRTGDEGSPPLKVYLFGGAEGVAEAAADAINARSSRVRCVGWHYPGFGSAADMSAPDTLAEINASGADVLLASLGAEKGQSWLIRNHDDLRVPVRAHVGAAINYEAGVLKRAPVAFQKSGLEWLWRIKEEPHLWRRYWSDGLVLSSLIVKRVLPLVISRWRARLTAKFRARDLKLTELREGRTIVLKLAGPATSRHVGQIAVVFRRAMDARLRIVLDLTSVVEIDPQFLGLVLVLRKMALRKGQEFVVEGVSPRLRRLLRLHAVELCGSPADLLQPKVAANSTSWKPNSR
jgi:N-acetylglucosaminyldiphosphoundecaprenol N-acetyl-beta-D-mannosaminyltransferase